MSKFLSNGSQAPPFSLTAVASQRQINLNTATGYLLLIFHGYRTVDEVGAIIRSVRESCPNPDQLLIASVADMRIVPRLLRGMANQIMQNAYEDACKQIPEGQEPSDHIIILPDWSGKVFKAYKVPNTSRHPALALINEQQIIQGTYTGDQPIKAALKLIADFPPCSL